jgi:hypothetical protein
MELTPEQKKFALDYALAYLNPERMYEDLSYELESEFPEAAEDETLYEAMYAELERLHLTVAGDALMKEKFKS